MQSRLRTAVALSIVAVSIVVADLFFTILGLLTSFTLLPGAILYRFGVGLVTTPRRALRIWKQSA